METFVFAEIVNYSHKHNPFIQVKLIIASYRRKNTINILIYLSKFSFRDSKKVLFLKIKVQTRVNKNAQNIFWKIKLKF